MNRLAGIIVGAIGLIVVVLSIVKVLPNQLWSGIGIILFGGLVIGLSFIPKPNPEDTPRKSTPETLMGIFYAPGEIFRNLRRHPRWLVAVLIMSFVSVVYQNAFMYRLTPERVINYSTDKAKELPFVNDEARAKIEEGRVTQIEQAKSPVNKVMQGIGAFIGDTFGIAFLSAVFLILVFATGGKINYWQSFAAVAYSAFPATVIHQILNLVLLFLKDPTDIHPVLGRGNLVQDNLNFLVTPSQNPALFALLSGFGILVFYRIWMLVIGLRDTGEKVSSTAAWSGGIGLWAVGLVIAVIFSSLFSGFLS